MDTSQLAQTFAMMLPFILAGMMIPSWTKYVIILLATDRPMANSLGFVLGNFTFRVGLGLVALFVMNVNVVEETVANPPGGPVPYLIVFGFLLMSMAVYLFRKVPRETEGELPRWLQALGKVKPWMAFVAGLGMVAAPGVQYVYFLGAMGILSSAQLPREQSVFLLLVVSVMLQAMLLTPILLFRLGGERSKELTSKFKHWLGRNEFKVLAVIFFFFGGFLLLRGLGVLG